MTPFAPSAIAARSESQERAWIARVRAGDYEAFGVIFAAYYGPLLAFAVGLSGSPDLADDVVQEVFVRVWERRAQWEVTSNLTAYLRGAVRNGVLKDARRNAVRERLAPVIERTAVVDPEARAHAAGVDEAIARAIARLPGRCRAVYTLRWYDQLTYPEIAQILGISVKTVEGHVTTAHRTLRTALQRLV